MNQPPAERTTRDTREHLADVINAAVRGQVTYITSRGRRVAAVVPLPAVEGDARATGSPEPSAVCG